MPKRTQKRLDFNRASLESIPQKYKILDFLLEFQTEYWKPEVPVFILSPISRDVSIWYREFEEEILDAIKEQL